MTTQHTTTVSQVAYRGEGIQYVVTCEQCGRVGVPQKFEGDADAIAARHAEIGGFER